MDFKKILKVVSAIAALVAPAAAAYVAIKKLTAKDEPEYFDDNDFFECDNEIEVVEVRMSLNSLPRKKRQSQRKKLHQKRRNPPKRLNKF